MLTMEELTAGPAAILRYLDPSGVAATRASTRTVDAVEVCGPHWRLPPERGRVGLAILPADAPRPADAGAAMRALVRNGVVAAVLTAPPGERVEGGSVLAAAVRAGLPLLTPVGDWGTQETAHRVMRRQLVVEREHASLPGQLLELAARLYRRGEGPDRLLSEVAAATGGPVAFVEPGEEEWEALAGEHGRILARVRRGQMQTAALLDEGEHVLLHAVGQEAPHQVMAAWRATPWPQHLRELLSQAASQAAMLSYPIEHRQEREAVQESRRSIRVSLLQYLMQGDWETAARVAEPLRALRGGVPAHGLLSAERGVLAVLQCARREERMEAAEACERAAPHAMVVLCPADYRHIILLAPDTPDASDLLTALRPVVSACAGRAAGVSTPQPWSQTAAAYLAARQALAAAEHDPEGIVRDPGGTPVASLLPPEARVWAHQLLAGLDSLGEEQRSQAIPTARRSLSFGTVKAGRLIGVDRTTANRRLALVMEALGLDHNLVAHRAVADLAFHLSDLPAPKTTPRGLRPRLRGLLREPALAQWARERLDVFDKPDTEPPGGWLGGEPAHQEPGKAARQLLAAWLECNCRSGVTAVTLGMHRNTLPARLAAASARLKLPLLEGGAAPFEVLWQLVAVGEMPGSAVPDPIADRRSGGSSPVRRPSINRMKDYYMGGRGNYVPDRELAERVVDVLPTIKLMATISRRHALRAPQFLAQEHGIRQFLDIGAGDPSQSDENIHDTVGRVAPGSRIVYVENDDLAALNGQKMLAGRNDIAMIEADLREPDNILQHPCVTAMLDFSKPVGLCMHSVMNFILDQEDPRGLISTLLDALPSGSYLSMIHGSTDAGPHIEDACEVYRQAGIAMGFRTRYEIEDLIEGLELLDPPGIVPVQDWAPPGQEPEPTELPEGEFVAYALVARKP